MFAEPTPLPDAPVAAAWLHKMNNALGSTRPRKFPFFQRLNNHLEPPAWLKRRPNDPLHGIYQFQKELFTGGQLVWGWLLQGHEDLFEPERDNHAALVLYARAGVTSLQTMAAAAGALATWLEDDETAETEPAFRRLLLDPYARVFDAVVPPALVGDDAAFHCTSLVVHREHLTLPWLPFAWLPLLVLPHQPYTAAILPYWYQPEAYRELWQTRALASLTATRDA